MSHRVLFAHIASHPSTFICDRFVNIERKPKNDIQKAAGSESPELLLTRDDRAKAKMQIRMSHEENKTRVEKEWKNTFMEREATPKHFTYHKFVSMTFAGVAGADARK